LITSSKVKLCLDLLTFYRREEGSVFFFLRAQGTGAGTGPEPGWFRAPFI